VLHVSNVYTSFRQAKASEQGKRGMHGSFPQCKKLLPSDSHKRRPVLESIVLIHNFHTELVGSKQVKMFFDPEYELYVNLDRFIRIG
jgi:hypothetical protein